MIDLHKEYEAARKAHDEAGTRYLAAQRALWNAETSLQAAWERTQQAFVALSRAEESVESNRPEQSARR